MFEPYQYKNLMLTRIRNISRRVLLVLRILSKVTVLLFIVASAAEVRADDASGANIRVFEFTSEFYMLMGNGRIDGLMVSNGSRHRIAIYWIEPAVYRDHTFFLGYSDFIFTKEKVYYWVHGVGKPATFDLSDVNSNPLLPRDVSVTSVARSALAIANRIMSEPHKEDTTLEVGKFFRQSRDHADYSYEVPSEGQINDESFVSSSSDVEILNNLPFGRKYSKQMHTDGTVVWRAQRVLDGPRVSRVTVKPVSYMRADDAGSMFDPETLGRWNLVAEPYGAYWTFDRTYLELKDTPDNVVDAQELNDKIESYLDNNETPDKVNLVLHQLWFKTAILTGDLDRVSRSARAVVSVLCEDVSTNSYQRMLELARIDGQVREQYPDQTDDLVRPLVAQVVRNSGSDVGRDIERFMRTIESNEWFRFGELLVVEARSQAIAVDDIAEKLDARLEAERLLRELPPFDPCEAISSVKRYLAQTDADPPKGSLTMDDIRDILEKGLAKPFADANMDSTDKTVADTVYSIRLIAGEGPFRGDRDKLVESVKKSSGLYLVVFKNTEPMDTVLATFLALSFYDISTEEDHDVLFSQIRKLCDEFQSLTNAMLAKRKLSELVTPADADRLFTRYKQRFQQYIDDPLWPAFKFPLTTNELIILRNKLKLHFDQLNPLIEEMSLKVRYGGVSDKLKVKTRYEIARAILELLPQAAFLRKPPYPGVSLAHRGGYGFTAVIRGPLYVEGERPREKFKAMKYFHMGHRLEDVVKRERELARN